MWRDFLEVICNMNSQLNSPNVFRIIFICYWYKSHVRSQETVEFSDFILYICFVLFYYHSLTVIYILSLCCFVCNILRLFMRIHCILACTRSAVNGIHVNNRRLQTNRGHLWLYSFRKMPIEELELSFWSTRGNCGQSHHVIMTQRGCVAMVLIKYLINPLYAGSFWRWLDMYLHCMIFLDLNSDVSNQIGSILKHPVLISHNIGLILFVPKHFRRNFCLSKHS